MRAVEKSIVELTGDHERRYLLQAKMMLIMVPRNQIFLLIWGLRRKGATEEARWRCKLPQKKILQAE
jgi:hypothetical protein